MKELRNVDVEDLRQRGGRYAGVVMRSAGQGATSARKAAELARTNLERRMRPRRRTRLPMVGVLVAGAAVAGAVAYVLYDRERRAAVRARANRVQKGARTRYAELGGGGAVGKVRARVGAAAPRWTRRRSRSRSGRWSRTAASR